MDIYEDLDAFQEEEEKKSKELLEWEEKYNKAQAEINNCRAEMKTLEKKLSTMEVNFQNLLDTAKAEIKRKDTLITELRKEKDDICFRRKGPLKSRPTGTHPTKAEIKRDYTQEIAPIPGRIEQHQETKHVHVPQSGVDKRNLMQPRSDSYKTKSNRTEELQHSGQQKKVEPKNRDHRSNNRDRDRSDNRRRSRSRSRDRLKRKRSRSRSHSREGSGSQRNNNGSRRHRSRSPSPCRSRSKHRSTTTTTNNNSNSNKSNKHSTSQENKSKKSEKKEKSIEHLFGVTPSRNSPEPELEAAIETKEKVHEMMVSNSQPITPKELYTPQQIQDLNENPKPNIPEKETGENKIEMEKRLNECFVRNVEVLEDAEQILKEKSRNATNEEVQAKSKSVTVPHEAENVIDKCESKPNSRRLKESDLIESQKEDFKNATKPLESKKVPVKDVEKSAESAYVQIPGLDLIAEQIVNFPNQVESIDVENDSAKEEHVSAEFIQISDQIVVIEDAVEPLESKIDHVKDGEKVAQTTFVTIPGLDMITEQIANSQNQAEPLDNDSAGCEYRTTVHIPGQNNIGSQDPPQNVVDRDETSAEVTEQQMKPIIFGVEEIPTTESTSEMYEILNQLEEINTDSDETPRIQTTSNYDPLSAPFIIQTVPTNQTTAPNPARYIEIIENIRLPVMMDIEHIALRVDETSDQDSNDHTEKPDVTDIEHIALRMDEPSDQDSNDPLEKPKGQLSKREINIEGDLVFKNLKVEDDPNDVILIQKPSATASMVMYAQPDSTKLDHSEEDLSIVASENVLSPELMAAKDIEQKTDNIELILEQLHKSQSDQPDEATVTSTSMRGAKRNLLKILMESPLHESTPVDPESPNNLIKSGGSRSNEGKVRTNSAKMKAGDIETTPLKKRKLNLDAIKSPEKPQARRLNLASPSQADVTIDETINVSESMLNQSSGNDTSTVMKRCSLGQSEYQFERIQDEVVLRVTRRPRRRQRAAPVASESNPKEA